VSVSMLVPINASVSSRAIINFLIKMPFCPEDTRITLIHIFREPSSGEDLMGKKFMAEQPARLSAMLQKAKERLVEEKGFHPSQVDTVLLTNPYPSVTEGIIEFFKKNKYDIVVIGRKKMSKSEEFVLGDISVKLVRTLENTSVLVVKTG
jgi:nucleotide-binding universal stress UspA family protein